MVQRLARAEEVHVQVRGPAGELIDTSVERSGSVHWQYGASGNGWELVLAPALALVNVLSHHLLWRRGWLIRVLVSDKRVWRGRFRSRREAMASLPSIQATVKESGADGLRAKHELRSNNR